LGNATLSNLLKKGESFASKIPSVMGNSQGWVHLGAHEKSTKIFLEVLIDEQFTSINCTL
jgi:hypothetical protein